MKLRGDEIEIASEFFSNNDVAVLERQARKINGSQPSFTAIVLAMEMHGLGGREVDGLLESIFVIYYAYTEIRKVKIDQISIGQLQKNIKWFEAFIDFYNKEKAANDNHNIETMHFIKDEVVLRYAAQILKNLFGSAERIPKEVLFPYFALLKAIEHAAEKSERK